MCATLSRLLAPMLLVVLLARPAPAQYMYLDSNGDGIYTAADSLNPTGTTTVGVWLDTAHDRQGRPAECLISGDSASIDSASMLSYELIMCSTNGAVTWGQYTNLRTEMSLLVSASDSTEFYVAYGGMTANAPGLYHLGTLGISVLSGSPQIAIERTTHLGQALETAFGSECPGRDSDNTLRLGRDWYDIDDFATSTLPSVGDESLPTPPPATGTPTASPLYVHIQLPNANFHVRALYFDSSCPNSGFCSERLYYANPLTGVVDVPLVYGGPFVFYWWEHVRIEFPAWTPGGFFDASLDFPLELYPESQPEDRITSYTVGYDPDVANVLTKMCQIQSMSQQTIRFSRASVEVRWGDLPFYEMGDNGDYMILPDLGYFYQYGEDAGEQRLLDTMAHEYFHAIQLAVFGYGGQCTPGDVHDYWLLVWADCAPHDGCHTGQSYMGSFSEGFADAYGWYMKRKIRGEPLGPPWPQTCWQEYPGDPDMIGRMRELNIAAYWFRMLVVDPVGAFNTFRHGKLAEVGGQVHPATTLAQFYSLWRDEDLEVNRWIAVHRPGPWSSDLYYEYFINAQTQYASLVDNPVVTGVDSPPFALIDENEPVKWIQSIGPNPAQAQGTVRVRAIVPRSRDAELRIYSVSGRRVGHQRYQNLSEGVHDFSLRLPTLPAGVYLLQYVDTGKHRLEDSAKLVILR